MGQGVAPNSVPDALLPKIALVYNPIGGVKIPPPSYPYTSHQHRDHYHDPHTEPATVGHGARLVLVYRFQGQHSSSGRLDTINSRRILPNLLKLDRIVCRSQGLGRLLASPFPQYLESVLSVLESRTDIVL